MSDDGVLDVPLRRPTLQGTPDGVNPGQLFAAAWAACFQGALNAATRGTEIAVSQSTVTVQVPMGPAVDAGGYGLAGKIEVAIPGLPLEMVQQLAETAHASCPSSRATQGNIVVEVIGVAKQQGSAAPDPGWSGRMQVSTCPAFQPLWRSLLRSTERGVRLAAKSIRTKSRTEVRDRLAVVAIRKWRLRCAVRIRLTCDKCVVRAAIGASPNRAVREQVHRAACLSKAETAVRTRHRLPADIRASTAQALAIRKRHGCLNRRASPSVAPLPEWTRSIAGVLLAAIGSTEPVNANLAIWARCHACPVSLATRPGRTGLAG